MSRQVSCIGGCRRWFDAAEHFCPHCGRERPRWNGYLHRTKLDNALYRQAESAEYERKLEAGLRKGYEIPVSKEIKKAAKQIVRDM